MTEVEGTHDNSDTEIEQPNQKRIKLNERRREICKVKVVVGKECGKTYKIGTSTSNCSDHLANIHRITQEQEESNVNQNHNIKDAFFKMTYHQESRQLELCQHLTDWVIYPKFQIPNPKYIKLLIFKAYNYSKPLIIEKLEKDANAVSLTCDLWTGRNRQGFLGIICSYLDPEFQLHEVILSVQYIPYSHTDHIGDTLLAVLDEWGLQDKTFMITTDNDFNMRKAIKDLELAAENIMWQPCTAHILQLVVGKDLAPIKSLVGHAKCLIDFFMSLKQSERLEKIQKQFIQPNSNSSSRTPIDAGKIAKYLRYVIADVLTHWNSSYLAWCRLLELKGYICTLEANLAEETDQDSKKDSQRLTKVMLTNDEWDLLRDLISILGPFEEATQYLGGSNYSTHSIMKPLITEIINKLKPDELNENTMNINIENLKNVFIWNEDQDNPNNPNNKKKY
ncbi:unnamed protein product [Rhizophagus irregularis]|uniref:Zinc finger bed domain-containing protein 1-like n=3 Tax=Rhizophagus irregularis TaxID=588596 RepID=A0A915YUF9_9GLOM|nr:unnamed protein product [Rhizophagus irregularis]